MNCAETIQDRPGEPACEMFGIKRRFRRCKGWPLGSTDPETRVFETADGVDLIILACTVFAW